MDKHYLMLMLAFSMLLTFFLVLLVLSLPALKYLSFSTLSL